MSPDLKNVFSVLMPKFAFLPQEVMVSCNQGFGLQVCKNLEHLGDSAHSWW